MPKMPTVTMIFAQATYVLATFVYISNVSAVTDLILTKFFGKAEEKVEGNAKGKTR